MIVSELESLFSLRIDQNSFRTSFNAVERFAGRASGVLSGVAAAFVGHQLFGFVNGLVQAGSALEDVSKRIGITTKALQELQFAAGQDGVSAGELEGALRRLSASAFQAAQGGGEAAQVYARLGVSVKKADGTLKNSEELLTDVAEGFQQLKNPTERAALAQRVFGRSGTVLVPFLEKGAEGLAEMRQRFQDLGGGFSEEFVKNADEVGDKMDELKVLNQSFRNQIGNALLPAVSWFITKLTDLGIWLNRILRGTDYVRFALYALAAASVAAGVAAITPWLPAIALWLGIGAAVAAAVAVFEDLFGLLTGKKSLVGQFIDEWLGLGTATEFVNNFHIGLDALATAFRNLIKEAEPILSIFTDLKKGDFGSAALKASQALQAIANPGKLAADLAGKLPVGEVAEAAGMWWDAVSGQPIDQSQVAAGRGVNAPLRLDPSIPRAAARGADAPLARGSVAIGQATAAATRGQAGESVQNTINVTVNAQTNADAQEIGRIAAQKVNERLTEQNRNLRHAHAGRSSR